MVRKYHKLQINPWHREEEPHNKLSLMSFCQNYFSTKLLHVYVQYAFIMSR